MKEFDEDNKFQLHGCCQHSCSAELVLSFTTTFTGRNYRIAGNFRGALIFVIFVTNLLVTIFSTDENF